MIRVPHPGLDQTRSRATACLSAITEQAPRGALTPREWDAARSAIEALPLTSGEAAAARNRLDNARHYLDAGERDAAGYELRLLTRSLTGGRPAAPAAPDEPDAGPVRIERYPLAALYAPHLILLPLFGIMGLVAALWHGRPVLLPLALIFGGAAFISLAWTVTSPVPWWPRWVEFGERFRYRNVFGTHTLEWSEVEAIRFGVESLQMPVSEDGDDGDCDRVGTTLRVALKNGPVLNLLLRDYDRVRGFAAEAVRGVVAYLENGRPAARRRAAIALGLLRPQKPALPESEERAPEENGVADVLLAEVLPRLLIAADDPDERVRDAARQALAAVRTALGVLHRPWAARRPHA